MNNNEEIQIADFLQDIIKYSAENNIKRLLSSEHYVLGGKYTSETARKLMKIIKSRGYLKTNDKDYIPILTDKGLDFLKMFSYNS